MNTNTKKGIVHISTFKASNIEYEELKNNEKAQIIKLKTGLLKYREEGAVTATLATYETDDIEITHYGFPFFDVEGKLKEELKNNDFSNADFTKIDVRKADHIRVPAVEGSALYNALKPLDERNINEKHNIFKNFIAEYNEINKKNKIDINIFDYQTIIKEPEHKEGKERPLCINFKLNDIGNGKIGTLFAYRDGNKKVEVEVNSYIDFIVKIRPLIPWKSSLKFLFTMNLWSMCAPSKIGNKKIMWGNKLKLTQVYIKPAAISVTKNVFLLGDG